MTYSLLYKNQTKGLFILVLHVNFSLVEVYFHILHTDYFCFLYSTQTLIITITLEILNEIMLFCYTNFAYNEENWEN